MSPIMLTIASFIMATTFAFSTRQVRPVPPPAPPTPMTQTKELPPPAPPVVGTTVE